MKKFIKRFLPRILLATFVVATAFSANDASAAQLNSTSKFYTKVVRCSVANMNNLRSCWNNWKRGSLRDSEIVSGSTTTKVSADETIVVMVYLHPDTTINIAAGQFEVSWESNDFDIITSGTTPLSYFDKTQFDEDDWGDQNWTSSVTFQDNQKSFIVQFNDGFTGGSGASATPMTNDTSVLIFALKAKSTLPGGGSSQIHLSETIDEGTDISDYDAQNYKSTSEQFTINYTGTSTSTDATLSALSVSNGSTIYPITPELNATTAAIAQNVFSTKVPSSASQVTISATANDSKAQKIRMFDGNVEDTDTGGTVISGSSIPVIGTGVKSVNPGYNYFTLAVTAQSGDVQNEVVEVYRLSNDADLSNLSVDSYSFTGTFSANTLNYTISGVPYSTKSLNVVGAKHDSKASVTGLGSWTFDSDPTAATTFTRDIVVTPEECNYTTGPGHTEVVQGATCSPKTYKITVNREAASTDANLKSLSASYVHTTGSSATTDQLITSSSAGQTFTLKDGANNESVPYAADSVSFTATANGLT